MTDASIEELPWVDHVMKVATTDLDASRGLLQRLLATQDALFATTITVASLLIGLALANHAPTLGLIGVPIVAVLGYVDAVVRVHAGRTAQRAWRIEDLFDKYVKALRERRVARPAALADLSAAIDRYQFGIERAFERVTATQLTREIKRSPRWWLYPCIVGVLGLGSWVASDPPQKPSSVCVAAQGGVLRLSTLPERISGSVMLVPCPHTAHEEIGPSSTTTSP